MKAESNSIHSRDRTPAWKMYRVRTTPDSHDTVEIHADEMESLTMVKETIIAARLSVLDAERKEISFSGALIARKV